MKIVSVDKCTVSTGDIDFSPISSLGDVTFYDVLTPDELKLAARDAEGLLVNKAEVNSELIRACKKLRYVGTYSTGYNNVDLPACKARGITVCNVPNYSTNSVSQHVFAMLLNFVGSIDKYVSSVAAGEWIKSSTFCYMPYQTHELYGKTFGVYGYGNIGRAVARIAEAFGMRVLVCTRSVPENLPYELVSKEEIFSRSDYLSLHCPLTDDNAKLVNKQTLSLMKRDAILINTARGGLVDEAALADALNGGRIGGACLDVVTNEPMRADNPLYGARNVQFTPHVAWSPQETRQRLVERVADNLAAYLRGNPINKLV
jgi:glycerate dehydrogenase